MATPVDRIKAGLRHPVIDVDGHTVEVTPVLLDFVQLVGGTAGLARFEHYLRNVRRPGLERGPERWQGQPRHWTFPANTVDRATASLPHLYAERMDEIGLDFGLVYPTMGIVFEMIEDEEVRLTACRAVNHYLAELHAGLADRLLPVGVVPLHTPQEGIAELDYVVRELEMRAVMIPSFVKRPLAETTERYRLDSFGIDSEYDYDPFWSRCVELKVVPGVHTPTWGLPMRESVSNYVFTHIGQFSSGAETFCRAAFIGGVFHRHPDLKVAALEGGVGWAASLYAATLVHWEKRNGRAIQQYNPTNIDAERLAGFVEKYGGDRFTGRTEAVVESIVGPQSFGEPFNLDDFSAAPFANPEELRDMFVEHIYVGCEADDPMTGLAFDSDKNPLGARFRVILGSDIGHWDVTDVGHVLSEAYELVEDGLMDADAFEEFTFSNPVRLYAGTNPDFFGGTRVEKAVAGAASSI